MFHIILSIIHYVVFLADNHCKSRKQYLLSNQEFFSSNGFSSYNVLLAMNNGLTCLIHKNSRGTSLHHLQWTLLVHTPLGLNTITSTLQLCSLPDALSFPGIHHFQVYITSGYIFTSGCIYSSGCKSYSGAYLFNSLQGVISSW